MIRLKNKINKSATIRDLRKEAEKGFEHSWQPELQIEAFMKGVEALLNLLHLPPCEHNNIGAVSIKSMFCKDCQKWIANE